LIKENLIKDGALLIEEKEFTKESIEEYERVKEKTFSNLSKSFRLYPCVRCVG